MKSHWFYVIWPIYTAVVTVFIFSFCLADPQDAGWKGKVTRALFYDLPAWFQGKARSVLPSAAFSCVGNSINYVFNEVLHPLKGCCCCCFFFFLSHLLASLLPLPPYPHDIHYSATRCCSAATCSSSMGRMWRG